MKTTLILVLMGGLFGGCGGEPLPVGEACAPLTVVGTVCPDGAVVCADQKALPVEGCTISDMNNDGVPDAVPAICVARCE